MALSKEIQKKIENRQYSNIQICHMLENYFLMHPEIRFGQALANLGVVQYDYSTQNQEVIDPFYEESVDMVKRVESIYNTQFK